MSENEKLKEKEKAKKSRKIRRRIRRLIVLAILLVLIGGIGFLVVRKLQRDYTVTYDTYTTTMGSISNSMSYSGSMQLINNTTYTAENDAKVREVYVSAGDHVAEGAKLMRLSDGTTLTAEFDGTVNKVEAEKGDSVQKDDTLVQVADFGKMQA